MKSQILILFVLALLIPSTGRSDEQTETHRKIMNENLKEAKLNNDYKLCERASQSLLLGKYKSKDNSIEAEKYDELFKKSVDICWELAMNDPDIKEGFEQSGVEFTKELYVELIDSRVQNQLRMQGAR